MPELKGGRALVQASMVGSLSASDLCLARARAMRRRGSVFDEAGGCSVVTPAGRDPCGERLIQCLQVLITLANGTVLGVLLAS